MRRLSWYKESLTCEDFLAVFLCSDILSLCHSPALTAFGSRFECRDQVSTIDCRGAVPVPHATYRQNVFHLPGLHTLGSHTAVSFDEHNIHHAHQGFYRASSCAAHAIFVCPWQATCGLRPNHPPPHYTRKCSAPTCLHAYMAAASATFVPFEWLVLAFTCQGRFLTDTIRPLGIEVRQDVLATHTPTSIREGSPA